MDTSKQSQLTSSHSASSRSTSSRSTSSSLTSPHPAVHAAASYFHLEMQRALRRQGLVEATRGSCARALRRLQAQVDTPLDKLGVPQPKDYFSTLMESHC